MTTTVADGSRITTLDHNPDIQKIEYWGFMFFGGEQREVREVHRTRNGIQIELLPR